MQSDAEQSGWEESRAQGAEYERLRTAASHVARAVAELTHAAAAVGDHAAAVRLSTLVEELQMVQAQIAASGERAFAASRRAAQQARYASMQQSLDAARTYDELQPPRADE